MSASGPNDPQPYVAVPLVSVALVLDALDWDDPIQREAAEELLGAIPDGVQRALRRAFERANTPTEDSKVVELRKRDSR